MGLRSEDDEVLTLMSEGQVSGPSSEDEVLGMRSEGEVTGSVEFYAI